MRKAGPALLRLAGRYNDANLLLALAAVMTNAQFFPGFFRVDGVCAV